MIAAPAVVLLLSVSPQQAPPPPPPPPAIFPQQRDASSEAKGTAVVRGRVLTADGRPLRRVQVILRSSSISERIVGTGLEGEYEILDLPAGRFTLVARRGGYLPADYGQRRYGEPAKPIDVTAGATLDGINFTMERAGVISGRLTDETGEPVARASVYAMQSQFYRGRRQVVPIGGVSHGTSDDSGSYRLPSLPPGDYLVVAYFRETWMSDGREKQLLAYAPSYFPGTASLVEAARVKVAAGQEAAAIDFSLVPGRAATLSGSVAASDGSPLAGAMVMLEQEIMGPGGGSFSNAGSTQSNADGTWRIPSVPPGVYALRASGNSGDRGSENASMPLTVTGEDIRGLALQADAGGAIAGRMRAEGEAALPGGAMTAFAQSSTFDRNSLRVPPGEGDGRVAADGTFMRRTAAGPSLVRASLPSGWYVKRVMLGDRDVTDVPQPVRPGEQLGPFTIVITRTLARVSGRVLDREGTPMEHIVVLFPADADRWHEAAGSVRTTRSDRTGQFRLDNVRPGEYLVAAVDHVVQSAIYDPEGLTALRERAVKLTVGDAPVSIDLVVRK